MTTPGQIAYEAYFKYSDGKSLISGAPLPTWDGQRREIQLAWEAAAAAVRPKPFFTVVCGSCHKPQMNCDCHTSLAPACGYCGYVGTLDAQGRWLPDGDRCPKCGQRL